MKIPCWCLFLHCLGVVLWYLWSCTWRSIDRIDPGSAFFCGVWEGFGATASNWHLVKNRIPSTMAAAFAEHMLTPSAFASSRPSNPKSDQKVAHSPSAVDKEGCHLARFYEPFVYMAFAHMCKLQLWQIVLAYVFVGRFLKNGHQNVLEHAYLLRLPFAYLCEMNGLETDVLSPL